VRSGCAGAGWIEPLGAPDGLGGADAVEMPGGVTVAKSGRLLLLRFVTTEPLPEVVLAHAARAAQAASARSKGIRITRDSIAGSGDSGQPRRRVSP
jgi:hypothetical protein